MSVSDFTLAELLIVACSEAWRGNGEVVATGIGPIPRIAAGLAKLTHSPELMMTDGEAFLVEEPVPLGPRGDYRPRFSGYLPFSRFFDAAVWPGKRHAVVTPTQIDRFGQTNISCLGPDYHRPKVQMLGARGFPGNSIHHINSMFVPQHSTRVFVEDEVDMVSSVGYNPARTKGVNVESLDLRLIVTDLCVMDFGGPDHAIRVVSLHPGVTFEQVQAATGFPLLQAPNLGETAHPTAEQLEIIRKLDPKDVRGKQLKDNPPGVRKAA